MRGKRTLYGFACFGMKSLSARNRTKFFLWQKVSLISLAMFLLFSYLPVYGQLEELENVAQQADMDYVEAPVLIGRIVKWILSFMGLFLAGMIIYGGVLWMTAGGNSEQISKARKTIINGIIGLVIVVLAYSIAFFVVREMTEKILK